MLEKLPTFHRHHPAFWRFAIDGLDVLLDEAANRGHGGTIVILDATVPHDETLFQAKHVLKGKQWLPLLLEKCAQSEQQDVSDSMTYDMSFDIKYRRSTLDALQRVAQLAAIDGALVINSNFEVIAFGATLVSPEWNGSVEEGPDAYGGTHGRAFDLSRYGTRHRSAANFAVACPNSIAFVISQDGPVRAFARDDSRLLCWPDCSSSMFV